ncbi:hypothetical protein HA402_000385 [Bradysia odoriphaga]|nr:hypothetical protein HA402_000385 [Bradysia odoriphaga]
MKQDTIRMPRAMGRPCTSPFCAKSRLRHCEEFRHDIRWIIFTSFWQDLKSWEAKQMFVQNLIKENNSGNASDRKSYRFFLCLNGENVQVCRQFFLSTLGLKRDMVYGWIENTPRVMYQSKPPKPRKNKKRNILQVARKIRLALFLQHLDKMESHYCRLQSKKIYIAANFRSKVDLYNEYKKYCLENGYGQAASYFLFSEVFDKMNVALFKPRKDQCDTCVGFKVSEAKYALHVERQKRAKAEKEFDKEAALNFGRHVFTGDTQAVKLSPDINATAIYYKTRLQGDLSSSSFVSCIISHFEKHCLSDTLPITLYSDGCGYQNRNQFLSNALSNFAVKYNKIVEQKCLEKGHTQMECDSAHAKIEKKLENCSIHVPEDYVAVTKSARKTVKIDGIRKDCPYDVEYLSHDFFKNFADPRISRFNSIRPGSKAHDPTVNQLRAMIYLPSGKIMYKIDFNEEYRDLPRKIIPYDSLVHEAIQLHSESLKITKTKFNHLQQLKTVIPAAHHQYYDNLKYQ